jgi:hypothetical protein
VNADLCPSPARNDGCLLAVIGFEGHRPDPPVADARPANPVCLLGGFRDAAPVWELEERGEQGDRLLSTPLSGMLATPGPELRAIRPSKLMPAVGL